MIKRATQAQGLNPTTHPLSSDAIDGAVRWLLRLRSGLSDRTQRAAFERWYACSAEHARALEDVLWIWRMLGSRVIREAVSSERNVAESTGHGTNDG